MMTFGVGSRVLSVLTSGYFNYLTVHNLVGNKIDHKPGRFNGDKGSAFVHISLHRGPNKNP